MRISLTNSPEKDLKLVWRCANKRPMEVKVVFSHSPTTVSTLEGAVECDVGDAIISGVRDECWPVDNARFALLYEPVPPTKMGENGVYRCQQQTVSAARLTIRCHLALPDQRGLLIGEVDDWLVQQPDGKLGIVAADIFTKTYEVLE